MAVRPQWRQRGLGARLMQWGLAQADRLDLEMYIEASPLGRLLYQACGFDIIEEHSLKSNAPADILSDSSKAEEWHALQRHYLPHPYMFYSMRRPVQSKRS